MTVLPERVSKSVFQYEQYLRERVSPSTRRRYGNTLWKFFIGFAGHKRVDDFRPRDVIAYRRRRRGDGVPERIINAELAIVRAYFGWEMQRNTRIKVNPALRQPLRPVRRVQPPLGVAA